MILRDQLELIVQKKKVNEVFNWFSAHFNSPKHEYITRCPFVVIQGPTGCGKTTTLKCIANEIRIPIKEFSETTDTTAINFDLTHNEHEEDRSLDKRRATRFEHFVLNHLRFNPLYSELPREVHSLASADSEFDDSDDENLPDVFKPPPRVAPNGVIIHIEGPLSFARSQKVLISTIAKMIKIIRDVALTNPRRVAVVFESLECDKEVLSLPTKFKQTIGLQTIKFNPIIRANMRKYIESMLKRYQNVIIDKDSIDLLINDCDGDLGACRNTIEFLGNRSQNYNNVFMDLDGSEKVVPLHEFQASKKQRLNPERFKLNTNLMRDITRSVGFFHVLGKIFYQKRLYPDPRIRIDNTKVKQRKIDRPFRTENSTESIVDRLDLDPRRLLAWLHQHYYKFCNDTNLDKASMYLDYLSDVDTISIHSLQTSQFYEMHNTLDQLQLHLAIDSTVYSLYEDQSKNVKPSHKKITSNHQSFVIKSSVENGTNSTNGNGELYSFSKPPSLSLQKLIEDHQTLLTYCSNRLVKETLSCADSTKLLVDYLPYISIIANSCDDYDKKLVKAIKILDKLEQEPKLDFDIQHESLLDTLEELEEK